MVDTKSIGRGKLPVLTIPATPEPTKSLIRKGLTSVSTEKSLPSNGMGEEKAENRPAGQATDDARYVPLSAISPLDGRYSSKLQGLGDFVSEAALINTRLRVEIEWLLHLADCSELGFDLEPSVFERLKVLCGQDVSSRVKALEVTTNHDVKAVEYFLRGQLEEVGASRQTLAHIHFACTSEDINNLSYALMLRDVRDERLLPLLDELLGWLGGQAGQEADTAMLSRTHGQSATPTTLGKELAVFGGRLARQRNLFAGLALQGKANGAVGNYNAHLAAYPEVDWPAVSESFVGERLGLEWNPLTTQIENHDSIAEFCHFIVRLSRILLGLARDMWTYISLGYFKQQLRSGEVGSSTMPHKVNPIDFENAEGNFGLAAAMAAHLAEKLLVSRMQRDLSDSTVLRSLGSVCGYLELASRSLLKGFGKVGVDRNKLAADLDGAFEVLAEPVQTVMRRYGVADAYEQLKGVTRGKAIAKGDLEGLIQNCGDLPADVRQRLLDLTPQDYIGIAPQLARGFSQAIQNSSRVPEKS